MNEEIVKIREELVGLSSDPITTRELLDKLTEIEIEEHDKEAHFLVGKDDVIETKDFDHYAVDRTKNGYALHYKGGLDIFVKDRLASAAETVELIMHGSEEEDDTEEMKEAVAIAQSAAEMVFRLPMFVFSHPATTYNIATIATQYLLYLQKIGEVPTEETENPEYDKFLTQMNELLENFAEGLRKEGEAYEKRMGLNTSDTTE